MATVLDPESERWLAELRGEEPVRGRAQRRLHDMLHRVARAEATRRSWLPGDIQGDLDHLCLQAAHDAMIALLGKLDTFRGASRFTTWAYKFVLLEVSVRLRRRAWSARRVALDEASWGRLAEPSDGPERTLEDRELLETVRNLVATTLTEHQRHIFLAVVGEQIPIDVIAERTGSSRGAVYKTLHDARRKLRDKVITAGLLGAG
jgi:RNA polymerase sigma-70 factor (ECF subfamily)